MLSRKLIIREYKKNKKTVKEIAKILKCSCIKIYRFMKNNNISKNSRIKKDAISRQKYNCIYCNKTISWITWQYGKKSCYKCSVIIKSLECTLKRKKYFCKTCNKELKYKAKLCQSCYHRGRRIHPNHNYCIDCHAEIINVSKRCRRCDNLYRWANKEYRVKAKNTMKISARTKRGRMIKENNPFFGKKHTVKTKKHLSLSHGGTGIPYENTEYGAEFDNALKEQVRFRDKYKCQLCGCSQIENSRQLDVHHKDYNKKHNIMTNLISLCRPCHSKTTNNKKYWLLHFTKRSVTV